MDLSTGCPEKCQPNQCSQGPGTGEAPGRGKPQKRQGNGGRRVRRAAMVMMGHDKTRITAKSAILVML